MHTQSIRDWQHTHTFGQDQAKAGESEVSAGIISLVTDDPQPPAYYKTLLPDGLGVVHTTVEVHQCRHEHGRDD